MGHPHPAWAACPGASDPALIVIPQKEKADGSAKKLAFHVQSCLIAALPCRARGIVSGYTRAFRGSLSRSIAGTVRGVWVEAIRRDCMPLYETVLIARNDINQQQVEAVAEVIKGILEADGGSIKKQEYWGLRSLAYRIKKNRKGHYLLLGLDAKPETLREVERQLSLNEDILRVLTLRVEEIDENPSPVLSRKGDDRGERGFRGPKPAGRFESGRSSRRSYDDREEYRARDENVEAAAE
jgi:small subunit ribosomal protein S6